MVNVQEACGTLTRTSDNVGVKSYLVDLSGGMRLW